MPTSCISLCPFEFHKTLQLDRLWLTDFRSYRSAEIEFSPGVTALLGQNGRGKTNVIEAISYVTTLSSFRGAPNEAMVHTDAQQAIVRAQGTRGNRSLLIESEISRTGRGRAFLNKQRITKRRDLFDALRVSVFSPDDLELVKEGPQLRRDYLDSTLIAQRPALDSLRSDYERVLKQRNALLRQANGRRTAEIDITLAVWDDKLTQTGEALAAARQQLLQTLIPYVQTAYDDVAQQHVAINIVYEASWQATGLQQALEEKRNEEFRRGVSLVGPHRDDVSILLNGLNSRTQASQGEQRSIALALRLAAHRLVADTIGSAPILLLDDVFSELDPVRSAALLHHLPAGQTILTSATGLPEGSTADLVLSVTPGVVSPT